MTEPKRSGNGSAEKAAEAGEDAQTAGAQIPGAQTAGVQTPGAQTAGAAPSGANMPIFYRRPRPLNAETDRELSLQRTPDYGFARATNSVILGAAEFPAAMRSYPIVFTATAPRVAIAVLGIRDDENLFITAEGNWRAEEYVPAYVRRYPFICLERPERNEMVLCIDEGAGLLSSSGERPLFENNEPTQLVKDALNFCQEFNRQTAASTAFVAALEAAGLLVPNQARVELGEGRQMTLRGFEVIDETKFNALPDDTFLDWRRRGWLPLVYCQLLSMANWRRLARLTANPA